MPMVFCPLYSGSSGNALYVEYGSTRLLIDAGKSGRCIEEAMRFIRVDPSTLSGILVTHEHSDHISGVGILARRYKLPVYANRGTWAAMAGKIGKIPPELRVEFDTDSDFYVGEMGVAPFPIPHDAAEPVGYRLWGGGHSLSVATDLGHFTSRVREAISGSTMILLESNHDPDMLMRNEHYSAELKRRILGSRGHLSNETAADALVELVGRGTTRFVLGHLSGENNTPALALQTSENRAELDGLILNRDVRIDLAWRDRVGKTYLVGL